METQGEKDSSESFESVRYFSYCFLNVHYTLSPVFVSAFQLYYVLGKSLVLIRLFKLFRKTEVSACQSSCLQQYHTKEIIFPNLAA
jgi:hypothetical protein